MTHSNPEPTILKHLVTEIGLNLRCSIVTSEYVTTTQTTREDRMRSLWSFRLLFKAHKRGKRERQNKVRDTEGEFKRVPKRGSGEVGKGTS